MFAIDGCWRIGWLEYSAKRRIDVQLLYLMWVDSVECEMVMVVPRTAVA